MLNSYLNFITTSYVLSEAFHSHSYTEFCAHSPAKTHSVRWVHSCWASHTELIFVEKMEQFDRHDLHKPRQACHLVHLPVALSSLSSRRSCHGRTYIHVLVVKWFNHRAMLLTTYSRRVITAVLRVLYVTAAFNQRVVQQFELWMPPCWNLNVHTHFLHIWMQKGFVGKARGLFGPRKP